MAEGNAGVYDFKAIKDVLNERRYEPIYHVAPEERAAKPRCPRWLNESCLGACSNYDDCHINRDKTVYP